MLTELQKNNIVVSRESKLYDNRFGKILIDAVSAVLDRDDAAASQMRNDRDRFTAVTTKRKEKGVQFFIVDQDLFDNVFFSFLSNA